MMTQYSLSFHKDMLAFLFCFLFLDLVVHYWQHMLPRFQNLVINYVYAIFENAFSGHKIF